MSLILTTIAGVAAYRASKGRKRKMDPDYLLGCDVLGASDAPSSTPAPPVVEVHTGSYWTSVAAGLTVAAILGAFGYGLQRLERR